MNKLLLTLALLPVLAHAGAYKCTIDGVTKYQSAPCPTNPEAAPLDLKVESPERQAKMQAQEKERDKYWADLKKAEADKAQAEQAARDERARRAYVRELERERQVINSRLDQSWQQQQYDRERYQQRQAELDRQNTENDRARNCAIMAIAGQQGPGCPPVNR